MGYHRPPLIVYKIRYTSDKMKANPDPKKRVAVEYITLPHVRALLNYLNVWVEKDHNKWLGARIVSVWVSNGKQEDLEIVHLFAEELREQKFISSYKERLQVIAKKKLEISRTERQWIARDRVKKFILDYARKHGLLPTIKHLTAREKGLIP